MPNELIINSTLGETRVARLENGSVAEFYVDRVHEADIVGNVYKGRVVRVLPGMQAAFVDIGLSRTAFLHVSDFTGHEDLDEGIKEAAKKSKIQDLLKEGREILVQVAKEPIGTKGARITSFVSLAGRYLVYMPTVEHIGISRRIDDSKERARLKDIVEKFKPRESGFIIRTASEGVSLKELRADISYLAKLWNDMEERSKKAKAPSLVHQELDVVLRVVRDMFTADIERLIVDSKDDFDRIKRFVDKFMSGVKSRVEYYDGNEPIFDKYGIEVEVTRALGQKVWLKSGGYIIVEQTEALTVIDVNTGKFVGKRNLEDTILRTNLEAVREVVYQLKLRNIGGIIVIDFIDMEKHANRSKVFSALKDALKFDRTRTTITKISELGLVEMTRKRTRDDLRNMLTDPCPYCDGKGYLKSPTTICYEIFRDIIREASRTKSKQITVHANPSVANVLYNEERKFVEDLEKNLKKTIVIKELSEYHQEQFEISDR
ncbi:MAG: Rne/Rng family ribonuclease [Deltaproteobacteria bacterium CG11_big_fil_rev_8_21_14_0_20_49_13]|nr:MAG: Rne/Rng family ribonuclease [Deltaproteobacteria bacterium CG11_big_fil_rev_8_21_14_0_20_49_13]